MRFLTILAAAFALVFSGVLGAGVAVAQDGELIERTSPHSVDETRQKLEAAIENAGGMLFTTVDHAAGATSAGMELAPEVLVIFGNPKVGTPIMQADPRAGLDLPIRVLIWAEDGETHLATLSPAALRDRYDIDGAEEAFTQMGGAIDKLMAAATAP